MKKIYFLFSLVLMACSANATVNFWMGSDAEAPNWSNPSNWSNGVPTVNDTVYFDGVLAGVTIDVNPIIAGLQLINGSSVVFRSGNTSLLTIGNLNVSGLLVFWVDKTSSLTIEGTQATKGVSLQTFGNFTSTNALIEGSLIFGAFTCTWNVNSFPASFCTTNISGIIRVLATNTGSVISGGISNGNPGTVSFLNGSLLEWLRSGGSAPNANFADGSVISVKGIAGTNMNFNNSARYNGLLIWNCVAQTASGSSVLLLPASNMVMDSVRIVSTGSGSVRMSTNPNGYTINSLEVNGGVLELGAPNSATNSLTDTITNEFKITGGTVLGNATFNFDNLGSAYRNTLIVKGSFVMTGGTLDYTNRNAGNEPGGAFSMAISGNIAQTGGRIKASKGFDLENLLTVNGTAHQQLQLNNITDTISLVINNANGVSLSGNLSLPYKLLLQSGYLQLNQYNTTVSANRIVQAAVIPRPRIVTNGSGKLVINNVSGSQLFPIAPFAAGYNGLTISNSAAARTYSASVAYGVQPTANANVLKTINRTWNISAGVPVIDNSTSLTFNYADSEVVAGATVIPAAAMVLGHYTTQWRYDTYSLTLPTGEPSLYSVGPFTPESLDSSFIIGNAGFISATYIFTGNGNWTVPANWAGNIVPPNPLPAGNEIIIDPAGDCILNVQQTLSPGASLKVGLNKNLLLPGNLTVQ